MKWGVDNKHRCIKKDEWKSTCKDWKELIKISERNWWILIPTKLTQMLFDFAINITSSNKIYKLG